MLAIAVIVLAVAVALQGVVITILVKGSRDNREDINAITRHINNTGGFIDFKGRKGKG